MIPAEKIRLAVINGGIRYLDFSKGGRTRRVHS